MVKKTLYVSPEAETVQLSAEQSVLSGYDSPGEDMSPIDEDW